MVHFIGKSMRIDASFTGSTQSYYSIRPLPFRVKSFTFCSGPCPIPTIISPINLFPETLFNWYECSSIALLAAINSFPTLKLGSGEFKLFATFLACQLNRTFMALMAAKFSSTTLDFSRYCLKCVATPQADSFNSGLYHDTY